MIERALCPVLIGREAELSQLEDAFLEARRGEGSVVLLGGEAGVGKTRLTREFEAVLRRAGATVLVGSCTEADLVLPYLPFIQAIGNHLASADVGRLREALGPSTRDLGQLFPQLDPGAAAQTSLADPTAKLRLFEAIVALLAELGREAGALLLVEDIHWADASTRELLEYLPRRLDGTRVLLVATLRSDELHRRHPLTPVVADWRRSGRVRDIGLRPLDRELIARMVGAIFASDEVSDDFRDLLHGRSEGNPFVLEEMLKSAIDRGDIYRTDVGWERREVSELRLPASVRDSILARIERLTIEEAEIVRGAAVLGQTFAYPALVSVSGRDTAVVDDALRTFVLEQLMEEDDPATARYRFRHALTREAIYDDIVVPRRQALHGRAADALRSLSGTPAIELANQLIAAGRWQEAVPVCLVAAQEAEGRAAYAQAAELCTLVLEHVTDDDIRGDVLLRLGVVIHQTGDPAKAQPILEEALEVLERVGDARAIGRARLRLGRVLWERSQPHAARDQYEAAREILEPFGPTEELAVAYARLASALAFEYDNVPAEAVARRAIEIASAAGAEMVRAWTYNFLGLAVWCQGRDEEGIEWLDRSYREATALGAEWAAGNALYNEIETRSQSFSAREALPRIELLRSLAAGGQARGQSALLGEGLAMLSLGRPLGSVQALEKARTTAEESGGSTFATWSGAWLAEALAELGRSDEARARLPDQVTSGERQDIELTANARARVLMDLDDVDGALQVVPHVERMLEWPRPLWHPTIRAIEGAVEACLLAGRLADAGRLVEGLRGSGPRPDHPFEVRARARLALAEGRLGEARDDLERLAAFFDSVGYRLEEWRTRRLLAMAYLGLEDAAAAEHQLRVVYEGAVEVGAVLHARAAVAGLAAIGIEVADVVPGTTAPDEAVVQPAGDAGLLRTAERLVSVLFVDIRGFTGVVAGAAPADVTARVASFQRWARDEVERREGLVDKFAGDAVMATFNVVSSRLDHAVAAFDAAVAIGDKASLAGLGVGAGIAVGPAVVGRLTEGANVSAIGETTNLAARLQAVAPSGALLLSEEAHARVRGRLEAIGRSATPVRLSLKGFPGETPAYQVGGG